jgi:anti-anti-sigma regulatory factor
MPEEAGDAGRRKAGRIGGDRARGRRGASAGDVAGRARARLAAAASHAASGPAPAGAVRVKEVGSGLWTVALARKLDVEVTEALRSVCIDALDRGALNVVVDLTGVEAISLDALDVLTSMSESLLVRGGLLWIGCRSPEQGAYSLLPVGEEGFWNAYGVSDALDEALIADGLAAAAGRA